MIIEVNLVSLLSNACVVIYFHVLLTALLLYNIISKQVDFGVNRKPLKYILIFYKLIMFENKLNVFIYIRQLR